MVVGFSVPPSKVAGSVSSGESVSMKNGCDRSIAPEPKSKFRMVSNWAWSRPTKNGDDGRIGLPLLVIRSPRVWPRATSGPGFAGS